MAETDQITTPLLAELCAAFPDSVWVRRNVGMGRAGDRVIRFGLPGQADIQGIHRGRAVEIETKTEVGQLSTPQKNWRRAVLRAGGTYIIARSVEGGVDAVRGLPF